MVDYRRLLEALASHKVDFIIVGGLAATLHGSARLTADLDIVYGRSPDNLRRIVDAISPLNPSLRGAPNGLPFQFDLETLRNGLNFTFTTEAGPLDLLGELTQLGGYEQLIGRTISVQLFGTTYRCLDLPTLIAAKRAAARKRDFDAIAELEAIRDQKES